MPRNIRNIEPARPLSPDIAELLVTTEIQVPDDGHFKGYIEESELAEIEKRDRKTMLSMSVHAQWIDWAIDMIIELRRQVRNLDAEVAKLRYQTRGQTMLWKILRWCGMLILGGALTALGSYLVKGK